MSKNIVNLVFHTDFDISSRYINNGTIPLTPIYGDGDIFMKLGKCIQYFKTVN